MIIFSFYLPDLVEISNDIDSSGSSAPYPYPPPSQSLEIHPATATGILDQDDDTVIVNAPSHLLSLSVPVITPLAPDVIFIDDDEDAMGVTSEIEVVQKNNKVRVCEIVNLCESDNDDKNDKDDNNDNSDQNNNDGDKENICENDDVNDDNHMEGNDDDNDNEYDDDETFFESVKFR